MALSLVTADGGMACFGVLLSCFHGASVANEVSSTHTSVTISASVNGDCHESGSPFLAPMRFGVSFGLLLTGAVALVLVGAGDARAATWQRMAIINNSTLNGTSLCDWNASGYLECPGTNPAVVSGYVGIGSTAPINALDIGTTQGIHIASGTPTNTGYALYNVGGTLYWNGSAVGSGGGVSLSANNTWTGTQTFSGTSSTLAAVLTNAAEPVTVSATAATGTINFYLNSQSVLYYTSNASGNWIVNFAFSSGTTMNSALSTGEAVTVVFLVMQGSTAYYNSAVQVDGTTTGVTTYWQGGTPPAAGYASGIDVYQYTIIKTASATYTILASQTRY